MGTIRDKMMADLALRRFASTTKKEYLQRAQNFVAYPQRPPTELGEHQIKFLYATTLARPEVVAKIPWPKRSQILPDILTGEEGSTTKSGGEPGNARRGRQIGAPRLDHRTDRVLRCSDAPIAAILLSQNRNRPGTRAHNDAVGRVVGPLCCIDPVGA